MKVIVSNGHFKFFLGTAASALDKRGELAGFIAAGYPTLCVNRIISFFRLKNRQSVDRLLKRKEEVGSELVYSFWISEIASKLTALFKDEKTKLALQHYAMSIYAHQAVSIVNKLSANIYHYRSGYGHQSAKMAKKKGMINICDHSIPNPEIMDYLVDNLGAYPLQKERNSLSISGFMKGILDDLKLADYIIVNSDFVKKTFVSQGWREENIYVLYNGVDKEFIGTIPERKGRAEKNTLRLMFAGTLEKRKGIVILLQALQKINDIDWVIDLVGDGPSQEIKNSFKGFFNDKRVNLYPFMSRAKLAKYMSKADVFIFPSLAEGSARTVFMSLACGCYVITTENTGSIVKNGKHGTIVPPGDVGALEESIRKASNNRETIKNIGDKNTKLINKSYRQEVQYINGLYDIYSDIIHKHE